MSRLVQDGLHCFFRVYFWGSTAAGSDSESGKVAICMTGLFYLCAPVLALCLFVIEADVVGGSAARCGRVTYVKTVQTRRQQPHSPNSVHTRCRPAPCHETTQKADVLWEILEDLLWEEADETVDDAFRYVEISELFALIPGLSRVVQQECVATRRFKAKSAGLVSKIAMPHTERSSPCVVVVEILPCLPLPPLIALHHLVSYVFTQYPHTTATTPDKVAVARHHLAAYRGERRPPSSNWASLI